MDRPTCKSTDPSTTRGWRYRWVGPGEDAAFQELARSLDVDELIASLLHRRGIRDADAGREFLEPSLGRMHDPRLLAGANQAAERLAEAVQAGQKIVIYGDYDVDGVTATAILYHILTSADPGAQVESYVPHRLDEGYGINPDAVGRLCDDGAGLIVSVDCGITAVEPAEVARERDVDLIITDHHQLDQLAERLPRAHTLVHPLLPNDDDELYPWEGICGAGVAYKLAWQFARVWSGSEKVNETLRRTLLDTLPLAALGTVADVVPLVDENRTITTFGLGRIKQTPLVGLNALIDHAGLREEAIDAYHVGFVLGPRLNAVGRLGHAREAIKLFTDASADEAVKIAEHLHSVNEQRRAQTKGIFDQAEEMVTEAGYDADDKRAIVLAHEDWHPGIVGIVCSRLVERFGRPSMLLCLKDGVAQGSARSIDAFNIHEALVACGEHLERFGGHAMAAGMRLAASDVDRFREAMLEHASRHLEVEDLLPSLHFDAETSLDHVDGPMVERILGLAPFGRDNPKPLLRFNRVRVRQPARTMGREARHMSMQIEQGGASLRCVGWSMGELVPRLDAGVELDLVAEPTINEWRGRRNVELVIRDLRWTGQNPALHTDGQEPSGA